MKLWAWLGEWTARYLRCMLIGVEKKPCVQNMRISYIAVIHSYIYSICTWHILSLPKLIITTWLILIHYTNQQMSISYLMTDLGLRCSKKLKNTHNFTNLSHQTHLSPKRSTHRAKIWAHRMFNFLFTSKAKISRFWSRFWPALWGKG